MMRVSKIAAVSLFVSLLALVFMTRTAFAQEEQQAVDPPTRVARLSYLSGDVSFQPNGVDDWVAATLNRPLTTSDRLWTARGARAELQTDNATMRLDGETSFTLADLDDQRAQIEVAQGVLNIHLRQLLENESVEIDTPNFTLNLLRAGDYSVKVDNLGNTSWVTVRSGTAEVTGGSQAVTLQPGQQAKFSGADDGSYEVNAAPGPDGFDQWCYARDQREENARSAKYVSRDVIGYGDLDEYGRWQNDPSYGAVWVPVVSADWAPYRFGHWAWIYPWGWTWVDNAPWGFAPFHYGRWVSAPYGWAWIPGPVVARSVYAPALVAWVGGGGWSVSLSFGGGYGWIPLGPREPFIPWYWGSRGYFSRVNMTNTRITNVYVTNYYNRYYAPHWGDHGKGPDWGRGPDHGGKDARSFVNIDYVNRKARNGVSFVDRDSFVNGRPVDRHLVNIPQDKLRSAPVMADIDAKPDRRSVLGGHEQDPRFRPPQRAFERPVVTRTEAPRPVPFESQARDFGKPRTAPASGRSNVFVDNRPAHVTVIAPRGGNPVREENRGAATGNPQGRWAVPHPPERGAAPGNAASHDAPRPAEQNGNATRPEPNRGNETRTVGRPNWSVPKPPDQPRTPPQNNVRERVDRPLQDEVPRPGSAIPERNTSRGDIVRPSQPVQRGDVIRPPQQSAREDVRQQRSAPVMQRTEQPSAPREARRAPEPVRPAPRSPEVRQSAPARTSAPAQEHAPSGRQAEHRSSGGNRPADQGSSQGNRR
jgi:Family of unknown function (DUF6600)/FecR protein